MVAQSPEEAVRAMVDAFMALYEPGATLVPQPGQVASGAAEIREAMSGFLALKGPMEIEPGLESSRPATSRWCPVLGRSPVPVPTVSP